MLIEAVDSMRVAVLNMRSDMCMMRADLDDLIDEMYDIKAGVRRLTAIMMAIAAVNVVYLAFFMPWS